MNCSKIRIEIREILSEKQHYFTLFPSILHMLRLEILSCSLREVLVPTSYENVSALEGTFLWETLLLCGNTYHCARAVILYTNKNLKIFNMADTKISVDSKVLAVLQKELKDDIKKKAKEKGWNDSETEDVISGLLKV